MSLDSPNRTVSGVQRQFFTILDEFFRRATGFSVPEYARRGDFSTTLKANAKKFSRRAETAYPWLMTALESFYRSYPAEMFSHGRALGGMKLVLGGVTRFYGSQLAAVRKMALYADTIFIPDPVLPWVEDKRSEERFPLVEILQNTYWLLHLKPLVDAQLPYPAIVVFPSWERTLERDDPETRQMHQFFLVNFISHYLKREFPDLREAFDYASKHGDEVLQAIDEAALFLPPGSTQPPRIKDGLKQYREELATWRSEKHLQWISSMPDAVLALNGVLERVAPQYHLLENADELVASPMLALDAHWFYFERVRLMYEQRLEDE